MWKELKDVGMELDDAIPFNNNTYLGCTQVDVVIDKRTLEEKQRLWIAMQHDQKKTMTADEMQEGTPLNVVPLKKQKKPQRNAMTKPKAKSIAKAAVSLLGSKGHPVKAYEYQMAGAAAQCVERYCELSGTARSSLKQVCTPCIDDHMLAPEGFEAKGQLTKECARIVLKALYLARIGRPDVLWTVNSLAREVTRWTAACDKRLLRLESYINSTEDHCMCSFVGDEAKDCKLALFCDASFAGDLQDSKSTSGVILCLVGPNTFCPISWLCKK